MCSSTVKELSICHCNGLGMETPMCPAGSWEEGNICDPISYPLPGHINKVCQKDVGGKEYIEQRMYIVIF